MEVIYRAYDGEEFDSQEACLEHEKKNVTFKMYDRCGKPTYSAEEALLINLCHPEGGTNFSRLCEKEYTLSNGINADSTTGWYWWNEYSYVPVDTKMLTALRNAGYFQQ